MLNERPRDGPDSVKVEKNEEYFLFKENKETEELEKLKETFRNVL